MNLESKAKLLLCCLKGNKSQGFTRTGLLVRILLYSCLATSLALTAYDFRCNQWFSCTNKVIQAKAKQQIEAANKAHQAYFLQNGRFTNSWIDLGLIIQTETDYYIYQISSPMGPVQTSNDPKNAEPFFDSVITTALSKKKSSSYIGAVFSIKQYGNYEATTIANICEFDQPFSLPTTMPTLTNGEIQCPIGSRLLNR